MPFYQLKAFPVPPETDANQVLQAINDWILSSQARPRDRNVMKINEKEWIVIGYDTAIGSIEDGDARQRVHNLHIAKKKRSEDE